MSVGWWRGELGDFLEEEVDGEVDHCVDALQGEHGVEVDFTAVVGGDAVFGSQAVGGEHR